MTPIAAQALAALAPFYPTTRRQAKALLSIWARREQLTRADIAAVLDTYAAGGGAR